MTLVNRCYPWAVTQGSCTRDRSVGESPEVFRGAVETKDSVSRVGKLEGPARGTSADPESLSRPDSRPSCWCLEKRMVLGVERQ